ncbi:hypothetical protein HDV05_005888 [Chytridiales sp. JEL 0842]|nr:hypothetical protein HDV05_005888 [Chytridiales sp. JEL 0842]
MSTLFEEEVQVLEAIYGTEHITHCSETNTYTFQLPPPSPLTLTFWIDAPEAYPVLPPSYRLEWKDKSCVWRRGELESLQRGLRQVWEERKEDGGVLDAWVEYLKEVQLGEQMALNEEVLDQDQEIEYGDEDDEALEEEKQERRGDRPHKYHQLYKQSQQLSEAPIEIFHGDVLVDKKSKFVAHIARVTHPSQISQVLAHLLSDPKIASATHNMVAYRLSNPPLEDRDDDGEGGAGDRMLELMRRMGVMDCVGVVTRWYGGIKLGGGRFRDITGVLKELIEKHGFAAGGQSSGNKSS